MELTVLVVDSDVVDVQARHRRYVESIGIVAKRVAVAVELVTVAVVQNEVVDGEVRPRQREKVRGPVLDGELLEGHGIDIVQRDELVRLVGTAVGALTVPVLGALAIDDGAGKTSNLDVGSAEDNGRVVRVGGVLHGHGAAKEQSTAIGNGDSQALRGRDSDILEEDVGARVGGSGRISRGGHGASGSANTRATSHRGEGSTGAGATGRTRRARGAGSRCRGRGCCVAGAAGAGAACGRGLSHLNRARCCGAGVGGDRYSCGGGLVVCIWVSKVMPWAAVE